MLRFVVIDIAKCKYRFVVPDVNIVYVDEGQSGAQRLASTWLT